MQEERRLKAIERLVSLGVDPEASQDETALRIRCSLTPDCVDSGDYSLSVNFHAGQFKCSSCKTEGDLEDLIVALESSGVPTNAAVQDAEFTEVTKAESGALQPAMQPKVLPLRAEDRVLPPPPPPPRPHRNLGERIIITLLALLFLGAGLSAAALSGFANYQAFSSSVTDPLQAGLWGWTGVIASVISFGGFTFFYWHTANKRMKEGVRALLFALAGAGTSILGTQMYIAANNQASEAEITTAGTNRALLQQQLADWRVQLAGIPPETRSVEGLEAYISEVERVGRTEQKPYRDAQNELGLARRRDALQAKIEAANAELLGKGEGDILIEAQARAAIPSWFFAGMLELFSSQGTSIGLVALLILYSRRRTPAADPEPLANT
ncbi:hypothetical protein [Hyphomonas johnsonii]|uniref:Uncharacterized protein n=1 Tax=Hyphomonas johnsonii MHS-2 TaxID=1280950 RepID=A0A059FPQ9_9PROT|nr:hypothetical protein [Hyphomonas johnsonii]KCZ92634.1 hypothetical protein HJO_06762 [Hyphomonas johnsonii MHS-2]